MGLNLGKILIVSEKAELTVPFTIHKCREDMAISQNAAMAR